MLTLDGRSNGLRLFRKCFQLRTQLIHLLTIISFTGNGKIGLYAHVVISRSENTIKKKVKKRKTLLYICECCFSVRRGSLVQV